MKAKSILIISALTSALFSSEHELGVRSYKANCEVCHGTPYKCSTMLTTGEWEDMFANKYSELKKIHANKPEVVSFLNSDGFKKESKYLLNFLGENSSDSGRVRACNGTSCG